MSQSDKTAMLTFKSPTVGSPSAGDRGPCVEAAWAPAAPCYPPAELWARVPGARGWTVWAGSREVLVHKPSLDYKVYGHTQGLGASGHDPESLTAEPLRF